MTPEDVARRLDNRAGYELIAYREVGLPIFGVTATALLLERRERSCIEEFALRALDAGLDTPTQIEGILGLPRRVLDSALADLVRQEAIRTVDGGERLVLAPAGKEIVDDAELKVPLEQTVWFPYDGLLRRPKWYGGTGFLRPNEAKEKGLPQLKPTPIRGPEVDELVAADVSEVVRLAAGAKRSEREVLRLLAIERRSRTFLPALALAYRARDGNDVQVGFAVDGRLSQEHALAFARSGGLERQPIFEGLHERAKPPTLPSVLAPRLAELVEVSEAQRKKVERVTTSRSAADEAAVAVAKAKSKVERDRAVLAQRGASNELDVAESELRNASVRPLPVYELPGLLEDAISNATRRVLIISPWIRRAVVDDVFLRSLRRTCGRGVQVSIGFGLGEVDEGERPSDAEARRSLEKLSKELGGLEVRRLGDTHAKILIKDSEFFVITSFNWLSFRGDQSRPFREEWGTIVRDVVMVDEFYAEVARRFVVGVSGS